MHGPEWVYGVGADDTLRLLGYGELQMVPALDHHSVPHLKNCHYALHEAEPRNRFPAWRAGTTTLFDVPARQAT